MCTEVVPVACQFAYDCWNDWVLGNTCFKRSIGVFKDIINKNAISALH